MGAMTLSTTTFSITTLSMKGLHVTLSISDTQQKITLSIIMLYHYAECRYAECHILFINMLNAIMLNVIMLNVVMLSVVASLFCSQMG
jgi:hypothetical protein